MINFLSVFNLSSITHSIKSAFSRMNVSSVMRVFQGGIKKAKDLIEKGLKKVTEFLKSVILTPEKKKDYVKVKQKYISKRLVFLGALFIGVGGYFVVTYAYPWADGNLWRTKMQYGSEKFKTFSGKAAVYDNGKAIYIGNMSEGKLSGSGKQYDENGKLVYDGDFSEDTYSGKGTLYKDEVATYIGDFSEGVYEGTGEQYDAKSRLIYKGEFSLGQRSGSGVEYDPDTSNKIYSGDWSQNVREGQGIEFDKDSANKVVYKGEFASGVYDGEGSLYENGKLKYKGQFSAGVYEGDGTLYDTDTGNAIYEGQFASGLYDGEGKLYDASTKTLLYHGNFSAGKKEGDGELYDKLGAVTYSGSFNEDSIAYLNYLGKKLEDVTQDFGKQSFSATVNQKQIYTYLNKNISIIFEKSSEDDSYTCEKILINIKNTNFKGLSKNSTKDEIINLLGTPYSSINYKVSSDMSSAFQSLSVDIRDSQACSTDKFLMDAYSIRIYYDRNNQSPLAVELSTV